MKGVIALLALGLIVGTDCVAQPKLSLDPMEINLGTMYNGTIKSGSIILKNIGNQPLKILRVQPSCGCTTVRQPKSELQPNESDSVEVSFDAALYRGPIEKYVNIETNDPLTAYIAVKLTADVKEELAPTAGSYSIWLGNVVIGKQATQAISFVNKTDGAIMVRRISSSSPKITATSDQKKVGPSDTLRVFVDAVPDKAGYDTGTISIQTDSKHQPSVELKVYYIGQKGD